MTKYFHALWIANCVIIIVLKINMISWLKIIEIKFEVYW